VNKFKLNFALGIKLKFCDFKSLFDDLRFQNIMCLCFASFFFLYICNFSWYMVFMLLFVMCCMCDDNDICRRQCGST
jgi:hypothetical protein